MADVVLTDFGLAKALATGSRYTRTGQALGTPAYMSPEQARGEISALTPATDVWGLGCVLYELLAGRRAFEGDTPAHVIARVVAGSVVPLRRIRSDLPTGLTGVVAAALREDPRGRYPSAGALRDDLDRLLAGARVRPPRTRVRPRAVGAGAAIAAGAFAVAVAAWPARTPPLPAPSPVEVPPGTAEVARARTRRFAAPHEAIALLDAALALAPERHDWRLERGQLLWSVGDGAAARTEWGRIPAGAREEAAARLHLGLEASFRLNHRGRRTSAGDADLAAAVALGGLEATLARAANAETDRRWADVRRELADLPGWVAALLRGQAELRDPAGDRALAIRELTAVLDEGAATVWALYSRARAREKAGDEAGARADIDAVLRLRADLPQALAMRGYYRLRAEDWAGAESDAEAALALDAEEPTALNNRALCRRRRGALREALADLDRVVRMLPDDPGPLTNRGMIRRTLGDREGGHADVQAAVAIGPGFAEAWCNRGLVRLQDLQDLDGAAADAAQALQCDPRLAEGYLLRANVVSARGDQAAAVADCDAAIGLRPAYPEALATRATAHWRRGEEAAAEADYLAATRLAPRWADVRFDLGMLRFRRGEWAAAAESLREALRLAPGHSRAAPARHALATAEAQAAAEPAARESG